MKNLMHARARGGLALLAGLSLWSLACDDAATVARPEALLVVDPVEADFGDVALGVRARIALYLSNPGTISVDIDSTSLSDTLGGEFEIVGVPDRLAPGDEAEATLFFAPTSVGLREGVLTFATDSTKTQMIELPVRGRGVEPALVANPPLVDFGRVVLGTTATTTVILTNSGDKPIEVLRADLTEGPADEFTTSLDRAMLDPGQTVELVVRYQPKDLNLDEGRVTVADTGPRAEALGIRVRGQGVESDIEVEPATLSFTGLYVGQAQTQTFYLRNIGTRVHQITLLEMAATGGPVAGEFSIVAATLPSLPFSIQPGEARQVDVIYTPIDAQPDTEQIKIESTGLRQTAFVGLIGDADPAPTPRIEVSPPALAFGQVEVGQNKPLNLRIDSVGNADLVLTATISIVPANAPYALQNQPMSGQVLRPASSSTFQVVFSPSADGAAPMAEVVIASNDSATPEVRVPLSGTGNNAPVPSIFVDPAQVAFGQVPRGTAASRTVLVRNDGSAPLSLNQVRLTDDQGGRFSLPAAPAPGTQLMPTQSVTFAVEYMDSGVVAAYVGMLEISSNDPSRPSVTVPLTAATAPPPASMLDISIRATWSPTPADIDLHLLRPGADFFDAPDDNCFCNPNPDWGVVGQNNDNPFLDRDDLVGPGPENINLTHAPDGGDYDVVLHYFADPGSTGPVTVTVEIRIKGTLVATETETLSQGERVIVGKINWNTSTGMGTYRTWLIGPFPTIFFACF